MLAFYSDDPSSNPAEIYSLKEAEEGPLKIKSDCHSIECICIFLKVKILSEVNLTLTNKSFSKPTIFFKKLWSKMTQKSFISKYIKFVLALRPYWSKKSKK